VAASHRRPGACQRRPRGCATCQRESLSDSLSTAVWHTVSSAVTASGTASLPVSASGTICRSAASDTP